jgi:GntP family gluconate:H+ symporter
MSFTHVEGVLFVLMHPLQSLLIGASVEVDGPQMATVTVDHVARRFGGFQVPMAVWLLLTSLALGLAHGLNADQLVSSVSAGFGNALGEYALILLPSFVIAFALYGSMTTAIPDWMAPVAAPLAGAAMMCPDTAYAALGPMTNRQKLSVLFGAYAGFKLLVPAGPLIVAAGLHAVDDGLAFLTLPLFGAAWLTGFLYARANSSGSETIRQDNTRLPLRELSPLVLLAGLLALGYWLGKQDDELSSVLSFVVSPKGALLASAAVALALGSLETRSRALESAVSRTAPLLLTIGAASAFGTMIVQTLPVARAAALLPGSGLVLPALFVATAAFKTAKGSSMATFAGMTGIVAALLPVLDVSPTAAVLAMCSGAFVTIAPNDSLYWIVKDDIGDRCPNLGRKLAIGALLQGLAAFAMLELLDVFGLL